MERAREGVCCARSPGWVRREALWLRVDKVSVKTHLGHAQFALAWRLWLEVWWSCSSRARTRSRTVSCLCARLVCPTALVGLEIEAAGGAGHRPRAVVLGCMSPKFRSITITIKIGLLTLLFRHSSALVILFLCFFVGNGAQEAQRASARCFAGKLRNNKFWTK